MLKNIPQQRQFKALLIGDSCDDIYHYGSIDRYCQEERPARAVPVFKHRKTIKKPGMASNVFENLKSLGFNVDFITQKEKIKKERFIVERKDDSCHFMRFDSRAIKS